MASDSITLTPELLRLLAEKIRSTPFEEWDGERRCFISSPKPQRELAFSLTPDFDVERQCFLYILDSIHFAPMGHFVIVERPSPSTPEWDEVERLVRNIKDRFLALEQAEKERLEQQKTADAIQAVHKVLGITK